MPQAGLMTLLIICILFSAALADEPKPASADAKSLTVGTLGAGFAKLTETPSQWQHSPAIKAETLAMYQKPARFDFRHSSALSRIGKLRRVSLLTLAEFRRTRLFLGVNDDGLVGLLFSGVSDYRDDRYLELIRMPYLNNSNADKDIADLSPRGSDARR